jgi:hypothetical protein
LFAVIAIQFALWQDLAHRQRKSDAMDDLADEAIAHLMKVNGITKATSDEADRRCFWSVDGQIGTEEMGHPDRTGVDRKTSVLAELAL